MDNERSKPPFLHYSPVRQWKDIWTFVDRMGVTRKSGPVFASIRNRGTCLNLFIGVFPQANSGKCQVPFSLHLQAAATASTPSSYSTIAPISPFFTRFGPTLNCHLPLRSSIHCRSVASPINKSPPIWSTGSARLITRLLYRCRSYYCRIYRKS